MSSLADQLAQFKVIPVIEISVLSSAAPLADALMQNGLPVAEVTFRSDIAAEALAAMKAAQPELLVGAGTVLTTEQVDKAIAAGADFIVSPGFNPKIVQYCQQQSVAMIPGVNSPSQIEQVMELGVTAIKFFPAEATGGVKFLKAILAPYRNIRVMPTGGINAANILDYLALPAVFACGGSWMVDKKLLDAGDFDTLGKLIADARAVVEKA
ncbi:bifunctional 4-hydroxy-2-oxoglutarate aldolase/2-dehydro-3-deoxy-phosphogluconate aldolase [Gynuella sunshinyii]|uniref:2-dehydro-3-deoxy-phosphogluconate aldolase n=1 Tax=Gynuella sunshinyii YC6258 TaxID=1445510 RepID=A0A0C5VSG2_9GAMM|nr:bifunctional 4-hydroxy-2-oxoglutarate aldolase/2-dehydro-3-deoxy-phosphogluconate aldolase [Gynuella sunshinyii]AJQ93214.1 2-keto-3-deoxy-6-phosphogluconate aldolase [Gynuella sunshinyii YC6258]